MNIVHMTMNISHNRPIAFAFNPLQLDRGKPMKTWKLEDAKNRFSEVVRRALEHEPQLVTNSGRDAVVVLSAEDFEQLSGSSDLVTFLRASPLAAVLAESENADAFERALARSGERDCEGRGG
jgi:prevent-host-death family protein